MTFMSKFYLVGLVLAIVVDLFDGCPDHTISYILSLINSR